MILQDCNLILCKNCHDRAPNSKSREAFLDWVEEQDYTPLVQVDIMRELRNFELLDRINDINKMLTDKELMKRFFFNESAVRKGSP